FPYTTLFRSRPTWLQAGSPDPARRGLMAPCKERTRMKTLKSQIIVLTALATLLAASVGAQGQGAPPAIVKPPQGTSVLFGSTVILTVQGSSATPLTYQWLLNSAPIASASTPTYSISNIQKANEG